MSAKRVLFENLAKFLNAAEITPDGGVHTVDPVIPSSLYSEDGTWGIAWKFNGGNAKWFVVPGPNLGAITTYSRTTGVN